MKKIYILSALLLAGLSGFGQTHKFSVNLLSPTNGQTLTQGVQFNQQVVITNVGPSAITPNDSIAYVDPTTPSGQVFIRTGYTKAVNDTIQINKVLTLTGGTSQTNVSYCVTAFMFSAGGIRTGFDTVGWRSCRTVNTVTTPASIGEATYSESSTKGTLEMFPNPTSGHMISFNFTTPSNEELNAQVFDIIGRKVLSHSFGKQSSGKSNFNLDISSLQQGMYIVELQQGPYKFSGRLLKD